jgi:DNA-binding beta-propeller fold protein YncE
LGQTAPYGEVANAEGTLIYVGGPLSVFGTRTNRIVASYPVGAPSAAVGTQAYVSGTESAPFWEARAYNVAEGTSLVLPPPCYIPPGNVRLWTGGGSPPDCKTFWTRLSLKYSVWIAGTWTVVYDTSTNLPLGSIQVEGSNWLAPLGYDPIAFSPDSATAYIAQAAPNQIAAYSVSTLQQIATYPVSQVFTSLAMSPDGTVLYASNRYGVFRVDAATGTEIHEFAMPTPVQGVMALSPDGTSLYLTDAMTKVVYQVNVSSGTIRAITVPYPPTNVEVLP